MSRICLNRTRWVLNMYRAMEDPMYKNKLWKHPQVANDGHSGVTASWTKRQAEYIKKHGFNRWLQIQLLETNK